MKYLLVNLENGDVITECGNYFSSFKDVEDVIEDEIEFDSEDKKEWVIIGVSEEWTFEVPVKKAAWKKNLRFK